MAAPAHDGVEVARGQVRPEWIDFNGHMNVAYYVLAFDLAIDTLWNELGLTDDYRDATKGSTFAVECHVRYLRELMDGDPYVITAQIVGHDEKRIHQFQRMYHGSGGELVATCEWLNLHVDLGSRRVSPWPGEVLARIARFRSRHAGLPAPEALGSVIRVPNDMASRT